jgi:hypothetical protein
MDWLVRKISQAKWRHQSGLELGAIAADAVTTDLRTQSNGLSLWACEDPSDQAKFDHTILALGSGLDRLSIIDVVWLDAQDLAAAAIRLKETLGNTPVSSLRSSHVDAECLDLSKLVKLAHLCADGVRKKNNFRRVREKQVLAILVAAVRERRLRLADLSERQANLRKAIEREMGLEHGEAMGADGLADHDSLE